MTGPTNPYIELPLDDALDEIEAQLAQLPDLPTPESWETLESNYKEAVERIYGVHVQLDTLNDEQLSRYRNAVVLSLTKIYNVPAEQADQLAPNLNTAEKA